MAIVNTNTPITAQRANEMILQLVQTYPELRSEVLTTSAFGREIRTLTMGTGERQVLFTAAHHANEWITALVLLKFAEDLAQAASVNGRIYGIEARTILKAATIHMVPLVDPDGVDLVVGAMLPMCAKALKLDPAVMASPFITTIVDALSLLVYFLFARALLHI